MAKCEIALIFSAPDRLTALDDRLIQVQLSVRTMPPTTRIALTSDHAAIALRLAIAAHLTAKGWEVVDIGPAEGQSTPYPEQGRAAAQLVTSGGCRFGIILCGTGQGIMMAANKVPGVRCGVCSDTFSARMIRQHNDGNMLALGARVVGEGLAL